ncbi:ketose-bisphosphate aldolase [Amnibacterium setariae]|uniref:Ketose-bisphosphate aldolase n=1 Tax=Amnibacterium setariae TaxID=2306585 RepID=A0A3A1TU82_9MICO|nr:ketose-bisphosphate aldolase [Amnibacterium setariae]RIX26641.1 ketose-bisphosphate aldolase [Amnibacterium setariae]
MLLNGRDLLAVANEHDFAVPAFNISDWAMFTGIIAVSEEKDAPLIVAIHPDELSHITVDLLPAIVQRSYRSSVPVAIHLDHGASYEQVLTAIQSGFTSVMIDKSMLPFEENAEITKKVVDTAHAVGLSVEGELGTIGKTDGYAESGTDDIIYTQPEEAARFVELTGVDSLAIAIGTRHGIYPSHLKPELKLDLLKEIKAAAPLPLVLHGGSNNPDDEIGQAVKLGVNKINISSDIKVAYHVRMREVLADLGEREPNSIQPGSIKAMNVTAAQKIDLFDAAGKASLY